MFTEDQDKIDFEAGLLLLFRLVALQAAFIKHGRLAEASYLNDLLFDGVRRLIYSFALAGDFTPQMYGEVWERGMLGDKLGEDFERIMPPAPPRSGDVRADPFVTLFDEGRDSEGGQTIKV